MRRRLVRDGWKTGRTLWVAAAVCAAGPVPAAPQEAPRVADASVAPDDESQLEELLKILEEETAIATRTRMNGDFVPGIVTVLQGEEMEALGFETVWDSLRMVPGIQVLRDTQGTPLIEMRGLQFPFNSGNVKILLDGLPISREDAGVNGIVLDLPLAVVERIEVIRGPGSVVYGDFAFMGLVNILTRRQGTRVFAEASSEDAVSGGFATSFGAPTGWHGSLVGAGLLADPALTAEPRSGRENRNWVVLGLGDGSFSLDGAFARRDLDSEPTADRMIEQSQRHAVFEAHWERELAPSLRSDLYAGYRDNHYDLPGLTTLQGGVAGAGLALHWEGWRRHAWMVDLGWTRSHIDRASHLTPGGPGAGSSPGGPLPGGARPGGPGSGPPSGGPGSGGPGSGPPSGGPGSGPSSGGSPGAASVQDLQDVTRTILSATLQDAFDVSDSVTLTAGARLDRYDDLGTRVTPRAALVWRASPRNILKLQYAEGFRPPTFFEQFSRGVSNTDLDFEVNATAEVNYVHRRPGTVVRATLFRTQLRDMIFISNSIFDNVAEARAQGVELEWQRELGSRVKAAADVSFVDTLDNRNVPPRTGPSLAAADWLGNLSLSVRATRSTLVAARWSHVGDIVAEEVEGYDAVDVTLTQNDLLVDGLELRLGVKNLFDDEISYPTVNPAGARSLPFGGRTAWVQLSWSR